jgi:superfamily II DNA or RNA helicase
LAAVPYDAERVLVSWFRSSPHYRYRAPSELRTKTTLGIKKLLVSHRSRNSRKHRYQIDANFGIGTLAATGRYLGKGFDDARLDTLFLTMPISWRGVLAQYAGRLHRLYAARRDVVIYDYVDEHEPMLAKWPQSGRPVTEASATEPSPAKNWILIRPNQVGLKARSKSPVPAIYPGFLFPPTAARSVPSKRLRQTRLFRNAIRRVAADDPNGHRKPPPGDRA